MRALLAAGLLVLAAGCGVPQDAQPTALDPSAAPFQAYVPEVAPPPAAGRDVTLSLVRGDRLEPVTRKLEGAVTPESVLDQLVTGGLTSSEVETGLTTAIPATVSVGDLELDSDTAVVTLQGFPDEQVRGDEPVAFAQIVATLDGLPGIEGVRFRTEDEDLSVPRGDGSLTDSPLDRNDYAELLVPASSASPVPEAPTAVVAPSPPAPTG